MSAAVSAPGPVAGRPTRPPRPRLRLRQDRPRGPRPRPARRRRRARLDRRLGRAHRVARPARDQGRGPHRVPRVPRGPGQDAAPAGARRHPRRHPQARPRRPARRPRRRGRSSSSSSTSTRSPPPSPRARAPTSASSRSTSADPSMVRAAAKNHPSVAVVTDPATYDDVLDAVRGGGFTLEQRKRLAAQAFVHTATYDVHVASWMGNAYTDSCRRHRLPGLGRRHVGPRRRAALRREPAPARRALHQRLPAAAGPRPGHAAARQGDVLQQLRRRRRRRARRPRPRRPADRRRSSSTPTRAASPSAPTSRRRTRKAHDVRPGLGLRRHHRHQPPGHRRRWRAPSRTSSPRSSSRPTFDDEALELLTAKKNIRLLECAAAGAAPAPRSGRSVAACSCSSATRSTPWSVDDGGTTGGDDAANWRLVSGDAGRRRDARRPPVRLAGHPRGQVERDPARPRRRRGRHRHGSGQPGRLLPPRRVARRCGAGARRRRGLRRVLPVRRRPAGAARRRGARGRRARRLDARRRGRRRPRRPPASRCTSPAPATSRTEAPRHPGCRARAVSRCPRLPSWSPRGARAGATAAGACGCPTPAARCRTGAR